VSTTHHPPPTIQQTLYYEQVRALLICTYDLGRQPLGLASPAAWLRRAGVEVDCVDTSRDALLDEQIRRAELVAFYLPMHTATRLAGPLIDRVKAVNPGAEIAAYGLYAPLNKAWLRERGVAHVMGAQAEGELVDVVSRVKSQTPNPKSQEPTANSELQTANCKGPTPRANSPEPARLAFIQPDRSGLPALSRYAMLQMPEGSRKIVGSTDATRGCKHLCRHCPVVPVYHGTFRAVPVDIVLDDIRAQVDAGAEHISFGDPDFFNGPTHARRIVERLHARFPSLTYDVTIKIEHLLAHATLLPLLRDTGCLFVTSAVESVDDDVLATLLKGHTRDDFERAVGVCRHVGLTLAPTFVSFTPWTTLGGYLDLLATIERLDLVSEVAPIQLAIRLLVSAESALLELPAIRDLVQPFDPASLTWPWRHADERVDALQQEVMELVSAGAHLRREQVFDAIASLARERAGVCDGTGTRIRTNPRAVPYMSEPWYCCAEPMNAEV
jgi:radical SAM superfamily enzyme YgiQ (UPF0313 family)